MPAPPPAGYPRISPYLNYEDTGAMMEWLERAFGLVERHRIAGPGGVVFHAEMALEEGVVMMGSPGGEFRNPRHLGQVTQSLYVYVDDLAAHCARARAAGAEIIEEPADQDYGDRRYGARDPEGHHWYFASRIAGAAGGGPGPEDGSASHRTVETTILVAVAPERVIQAFLDHDDLAGWWKVSRSLVGPTPGAPWSVAWDGYGEERQDHSWVGVVREREARRLVIDPLVQNEPGRPLFGPLALEILARPEGGGSRVTVLHRGYRRGEHWDWLHDAVVEGWREVLGELKRWLES